MKVVYHPAVQRDVSTILRHYDGINDRLGDEPHAAYPSGVASGEVSW